MNFDGFHPFTTWHYLKSGWQNAVLIWYMLQAGPPTLHYYCAVVLHSCIVLPPVCHSSNHQYHCCQLTDNRAMFRNVIALLMCFLWLSLVFVCDILKKKNSPYISSYIWIFKFVKCDYAVFKGICTQVCAGLALALAEERSARSK